jgi:hypothetical protein
MAPELGFALIKVDCTNHFSALAMMKLKAQCVFSMKYTDYCCPDNNEPVFKLYPPHTGVKTFVQTVPRGEWTSHQRGGSDRNSVCAACLKVFWFIVLNILTIYLKIYILYNGENRQFSFPSFLFKKYRT